MSPAIPILALVAAAAVLGLFAVMLIRVAAAQARRDAALRERVKQGLRHRDAVRARSEAEGAAVHAQRTGAGVTR